MRRIWGIFLPGRREVSGICIKFAAGLKLRFYRDDEREYKSSIF